jgi:membrane-associated phospholipid phosphatase
MNIRRYTSSMHTTDVLLIAWAVFLSVVNIVFSGRLPYWRIFLGLNAASVVFIVGIATLRGRTASKFIRIIHDWYIAPAVFLTFKQLYYLIKPIHLGADYDDWLILADRWLFGVDPTVWLYRFAHPVITEVLMIAYTLFYLLFLIIGYEFYRRGERATFHLFMFTCVYGFLLSYLGYFTLPAVGPRFTIHDFAALERELPGLWLTPHLRWFVNVGESIPMGVPNDVAIALTQRDVFPSGHTMMTLVLIYYAWHYRERVRWFVTVTGALLIVATVYQRYHYVVDLIAGSLFMLFCVWSAPRLNRWIAARLQTLERSLLPPSGA